jgi:hypothetical protein
MAKYLETNFSDSLVIVMGTGIGWKRAMLLNLVQAALSYIGFAIAVFIDNSLEQFDTWIYAVAAGNYLYICIGCLVSWKSMNQKFSEKKVRTILLHCH